MDDLTWSKTPNQRAIRSLDDHGAGATSNTRVIALDIIPK